MRGRGAAAPDAPQMRGRGAAAPDESRVGMHEVLLRPYAKDFLQHHRAKDVGKDMPPVGEGQGVRG